MVPTILGISGSPRKDGCTSYLVKRALGVCKEYSNVETQFISLADKDLKYCRGCFSCKKADCILEDDTAWILDEMKKADALIIGSPTYLADVTGRLKTLFDRSLRLRLHGFELKDKVGGAIVVGGSRNGGQEMVASSIHNWMKLHDMYLVVDINSAHFGGIAVGHEPSEVKEDDEGLKTVDNLACRVVESIV